MSDNVTLSVAELSEYCRTQAALLAGRVETISAETGELLREIEKDIASLRSRTRAQANGPGSSTSSPETPGSSDADGLTPGRDSVTRHDTRSGGRGRDSRDM